MRNLPAAEAVVMSLRQHITEGVLKPGTRLVDAVMAEEYGVSRNTVRDALRLLQYEGLLSSVRNAGYSVRTLSAADVRDIYAARRVIEVGAVQRSASAADEQLERIAEQEFVDVEEEGRPAPRRIDGHRNAEHDHRRQEGQSEPAEPAMRGDVVGRH